MNFGLQLKRRTFNPCTPCRKHPLPYILSCTIQHLFAARGPDPTTADLSQWITLAHCLGLLAARHSLGGLGKGWPANLDSYRPAAALAPGLHLDAISTKRVSRSLGANVE